MKRFILAAAVCLSVLGLTGIASAHPPGYVRVYGRPIIAPAIVTPAPVIVNPAPVIGPPVEIVRPIYHSFYHHGWWRR